MGALPGTSTHLAGELFKKMAGIIMAVVPYKSNINALTDLLGGHIDLTFITMPTLGPHAKAGRVRPLAVVGARRSQLMPELPTVAEAALPGFASSSWYAMLATMH